MPKDQCPYGEPVCRQAYKGKIRLCAGCAHRALGLQPYKADIREMRVVT